MPQSEFDFSDRSLHAEERLAGLFALSRGLVLAMQDTVRRLAAYNDLLEEEFEPVPAAVEYLKRSRDVMRRAEAWLNACDGKVRTPADFEPFAVGVMVEGVVKRCRRILGAGEQLAAELPDEEVVVAGALFQLQELFMSVLLGFVRSSARTGRRVTLRLSQQLLEEGPLSLLKSRCAPNQRHVVITVSDQGESFLADRQAPFWDSLLAMRDPGADEDWLNLLQLYGIVADHGGDVFFQESAAGARTLNVVLPVQSKRKGMQAPGNLEDQDLRGNETILLVDDEDMIWDVIIDMLQELGYTVILAGNGVEAVEIYKDNPGTIDLVLLDMVMPKMDGHETFFQLRKIDPAVRVLLSSGYVSEDDARDVLEAGAAGFLQKPYRMVDLARKIRSIFATPAH